MLSDKIKKLFPGIEGAIDNPKVKKFVELAERYLEVQKELSSALCRCQQDGFFPGPTDSARYRLPTQRKGMIHQVEFLCEDERINMYIQPGLFDDGRLGEIFLHVDKQGSFTAGMVNAFSIVLSLALQYGVPLGHILSKLENERFGKLQVLSASPIKFPASVVDYIAKVLKRYLPKEEAA
jgi:hypothetical protein